MTPNTDDGYLAHLVLLVGGCLQNEIMFSKMLALMTTLVPDTLIRLSGWDRQVLLREVYCRPDLS